MPRHRKTNTPLKKIWETAGQPLSLTALSLAILAALVLIVIPRVTGSYTYTVLTTSMAPHYPPGTFLVVKPVPFETLRTGDVITYQIESGRPDVVTHRIVAVSSTQQGERTLITRGDNNSVDDDSPVREVQLRGKLFYAVPAVGFLASAAGLSERDTLVQFLAVGLLTYGVFTSMRSVLDGRKRHAAASSPPLTVVVSQTGEAQR